MIEESHSTVLFPDTLLSESLNTRHSFILVRNFGHSHA